MAAVHELQDKVTSFAVQIDGWTDINGEYWMQLVKIISGYAFYDGRPTEQGQKCDAAWTIEQCRKSLSDPKCAALTADNCAVMQDTKEAFLKLAEKLKHVVFYANCQWHGGDLIGAALIGEAGAQTKCHVLELKTGPEKERWTLECAHKSSIPMKLKGIVKAVKGRHRLKGNFEKLQAAANAASKEAYREACASARAFGDDLPLRPRKLPALALPGTTRKLSWTNCFATVFANREVLDTLFRSSIFDNYLVGCPADAKILLTNCADAVKEGTLLNQAGVLAKLFGILQIHQRMCEVAKMNLSDGIYHICELLERIQLFQHEMITVAMKATIKEAVLFRFRKLYVPEYALAVMLDPRRRFSGVGINLPDVDIAADARNILKKRIKVLPQDVQDRIMIGYNALVAGEVFDFTGKDFELLARADDMPADEWWAINRTEIVQDLSVFVAERLMKVPLAQAGVERLNSSAKWIQAGRHSLLSWNARWLTAIFVNGRVRDAYHRAIKSKPPGFYRLGAHWPPRAADACTVALDDAIEEGELVAQDSVLRSAIAALEADEEAALCIARAGRAATNDGAGGSGAGGAAAPPRVRKRRASRAEKGKGKAGATTAAERKKQRRTFVAEDTTTDEDSDNGHASPDSDEDDESD